MSKTRIPALAVMGIAVALCAGCRYATNKLIRDDIRTVYVEFLDNSTFRRGLEVALTRSVVDEIKLRTPLLFAPRDEADSILSGELLEVDETPGVKDEDDQVLLRRVTVRIRLRWRDRLTGDLIVPEQVVEESARVSPALEDMPLMDRLALPVQRQATPFDLVFQEAAQRIVEKMEEEW